MTSHVCLDGWICQKHLYMGFPHSGCSGPGIACPVCNPTGARKSLWNVPPASASQGRPVLKRVTTAYHFTIAHGDRLKGHGLIAPDARYVSISWRGAERLARGFVEPESWRHLEAALTAGWHEGIVPRESLVGQALGVATPDRSDYTVQFVTSPPIDAEPGAAATAALDGYLQQQPFV